MNNSMKPVSVQKDGASRSNRTENRFGEMDRRDFMKTSALVGGAVAVAGAVPWSINKAADSLTPNIAHAQEVGGHSYLLGKPESVIYSVCLNCHTSCSIKTKVQDGIVVKVDGNPYSPMNLIPHLAEETGLADSAKVDAKLCPKGQGSVQVAYDPYRPRKVLKRAGKRGEGKWQGIEWNQFMDEVIGGGDLFGEGEVEGLDAIYKLRDPDLANSLAEDSDAVAAGDMSVNRFKTVHADHLDMLIDPDHPDLGPVNNQLVFMGGRMEHGRKELGKRFLYSGFGSTNFYLHTTICEQSHHIAYKEMSNGKTHMKPDFMNSEFVIFFGTGAFEANFGPTPMTELVTDSLVRNNFKMAVIDPRLSKTAAKAWKWVPIQPGGDGAFAMGMLRWIIENERYDEVYLRAPNKDAANANDETSYTDATNLVRTDEMIFVTPEEAGLESLEDGDRVVMVNGDIMLADEAKEADLFVDTTVDGIPVKSAMQLIKDRVNEMLMEDYAEVAGVSVANIELLADEYTSHGKKAAVDFYRGPVQHTNGYYNGTAIVLLNVLIGNADWKGGLTTGGSHWHEDGSKGGAPFPKSVVISAPGGTKNWGIHINREKANYENSTLFDGYPATRPWYPYTTELYQNIIPSAAAGYPYGAKCLFIHMGTPILASPAGHAQIEMLRDSTLIPLVIASDVVVGETSMYADYIIPDLTFMERWGTPHTTPAILTKVSKIRQPSAQPLTEIVEVDGEEMPICMETFLLDAGKRLGLAGYGKDGLGEGWDYNRPEDYYLALISNLAFGDKEDASEKLPEADEEEMRIFREARSHLPPAVFDEDKWRKAVPEELWGSVVYMLNRGGRFEDAGKSYKGDKIAHQWKGHWNIFVEHVAKGHHSMTGERFSGLPLVEPVLDAGGNPINDEGYDMTLITHKEIVGGQSRTHGAAWLQSAILPENHITLNRVDAERLGLQDDDMARIVSASLPDARFELGDGRTYEVKGKVKVLEGLRPGVVTVAWSYGHWAYGSNDVEIDGQVIAGDPRRATGTVPNPSMRIDPVLGDVSLTDPIGGSASFFDTKVRIEKIVEA
jgi:tetrathionate reductase subunit A